MFNNYIIIVRLYVLSIILLISSCSSIMIEEDNKYNRNKLIEQIMSIDATYNTLDSLLYVDIEKQNMYFLKKGTIINDYPISSSSYGTGSRENSFQTPLGKHQIYMKIGKTLPINAILKGRVWNGSIANVVSEDIDTEFDHVTSRILWLDGLEPGLNKGPGVDSKSRYIYIHGTAEEGLIGKPASDGCIRMYNKDVIELFNSVDEGSQVWIY